ncbi:BTAD domain-containing putative transcriptional regulator [Actinomadura sp. 21ATH]|uniref:BTAD domain-containing putative transcriptional regulator n=1 Tax=Actinomadura sp. 21ATH TaxID=1735444 RepID=UPI0035C09297
MRFGTLGAPEVWDAAGAPVRIPEARVRALLVALLLREGRPVPPDRLVDELWGDRAPADPRRVLRSKISLLRGVLDRAEPGGRDRLTHGPGGYRLAVEDGEVDAHRFRALLERARRTRDAAGRAALCTRALELWRGPAFAGFADGFAGPAAARLEEERLTVLELRAEARLELGEHRSLAEELGELVHRHPLRERLQAAWLRALYGAGRQAEALRSYEASRRRLAEELGTDPGPELSAAYQEILRQPVPAARTVTNLPALVDVLVGREEEVAAVRNLLAADGPERLVTLTGPGGVGKTRLAIEAAGREAADATAQAFPDGVWLVELAPLPPSAGGTPRVVETVADVLGVRDADAGGDALAGRVAEALRESRCLLVLDNCEHVLAEVGGLAARLLRAAPALRLLVTSREPLGIAGERVVEVPPLAVPPAGAEAGAASFGAVELFAARAAASAPGFVLDERTAPFAAAICRRLDGLPLALELAARRVRALGVEGLAARLDDRFRLLGGGGAGRPDRHRTLRAAIDWSWDLLTEREQEVLRRLVVHADGCTLEAAEATGGDVLDPLARLVDRSLVGTVDGPSGTRYRLLECIAAYARERLEEAGETETARERHMRYYADLAERADAGLRGSGQRDWLGRLGHEHANFHAAFDTAVDHRDADTALRLAVFLFWYRWLRGRHREAHRMLVRALDLAGGSRRLRARAGAFRAYLEMVARESAEPLTRVKQVLAAFDGAGDEEGRTFAQWLFGPALVECGELDAAETQLGLALSAFRARGDRWGIAAALGNRAYLAYIRGGLPRFETDGEEALRTFTELGDDWGRLEAMAVLWRHADTLGDHAQAALIASDALELAERLGIWLNISFWTCCLGRAALVRGDLAEAARRYRRALKISTAHGEAYGARLAELGLGMALRRAGSTEQAVRHLRTWLGADPGDHRSVDVVLAFAELGFLAEQRGGIGQALREHRRALAAARATGAPGPLALALAGLAGAYGENDPRRAARLLGAADGLLASAGAALPLHRADIERARARARAGAGEESFGAAYDRGRALSPEEVIAEEAR